MYFTYDGFSFENILNIKDLNLGITPERTNHTYTIGPHQHGGHYDGFNYEMKTIEIEFNTISDRPNDFKEIRRKVGEVLHVSEPKKLIFSHEPEVYWLAVPDGEQNLNELLRLGEGTLTFLSVEPYAFLYTEKEIELIPGERYLDVFNEGVVDTPLKVEAIFDKGDNGVFTILNKDQVFSYGDMEQVDTVRTERTEKLLHHEMENISDWYTDDSIKPSRIKTVDNNTGSFKTDRHGVYLSSSGTYPEGTTGWGGRQILYDLPADSANSTNHTMFNLNGRVQMQDKKSAWKATGIMYIAVLDEMNRPIAYITWSDASTNYKNQVVSLYYVELNEDGSTKDVLMRKEHTNDFKGDFSMVQENKGRGWNMYIRCYNGTSGNIMNNNNRYFFKTAPRAAKKVHIFMGNNIAPAAGPDYDSMGVTNISFRKYYPDVPDGQVKTVNAENYFMKGDYAYFDMETGQTFVNGLPEIEGRAVDSDLIQLPPGASTLGFDWSRWAKQPRVIVSFRERFLS